VARIDEAIPDLSFDINNDNGGVKRVYGIRDYGQQAAYWSYPNSAQNPIFPNRVLAYNYISSNFFIYEDSFTTFGYYQPTSDLTWATLPYPTWEAWTDPWNSGTAQAGYPDVVAGNQTGGVVVIDTGTWNDFAYAIANISGSTLITVNVPNHNLESGQFVRFSGIVSTNTAITNFLNGPIYQVNVLTANTFSIAAYNRTTGQFINVSIVGSYTYLGGGLMGTCPKPVLKSKFFCPFYEDGTAMRLNRIDYYMDRTAVGEVIANIYINDNTNNAVNDPTDPTNVGLMGDNTVTTYPSSFYPYQATQPRIWHPTYPNVKCQSFQYELTLNSRQMSTPTIYGEPIVLHATIFYAQPAGRLNP
jgi:hypothetical protein